MPDPKQSGDAPTPAGLQPECRLDSGAETIDHGEYWRWCPRCSHELHNERCKLRCPRCHYFMSCSDFD